MQGSSVGQGQGPAAPAPWRRMNQELGLSFRRIRGVVHRIACGFHSGAGRATNCGQMQPSNPGPRRGSNSSKGGGEIAVLGKAPGGVLAGSWPAPSGPTCRRCHADNGERVASVSH
ncbi:hypothetical protein GGTG_12361 [Gaeumannomyces tritici R3-111a-1]|uniref:Uncharacterized protein n=1 Tax=Gaeumannomyces tritici (strain R3-111a-1) TaxID=644352 RepID=J3PFT6_GAET3|nr:hypothetical protein GGTG_12361 [Gaeumannomyces tritici R3-111a-1]EJT70188.1 hypothetical protein GGTG_12361 [Gaeumannomyces tritici R3-111a-1]